MPVDAASYSSLPKSCSPSCCLGGADVGSTIRDFMTSRNCWSTLAVWHDRACSLLRQSGDDHLPSTPRQL